MGRLADISPRDFERFAGAIHELAGIYLHPSKRPLLVRRLAGRVQELGLSSFAEYFDRVVDDRHGDETVRMLDLIATNETHFFREPAHFEFLEAQVFPRWRADAAAGRRAKVVRAWSAACSTGQEPYSLAMQLLTHFPVAEGWHADLLASDISTRVLGVAAGATWPVEKAAEIPRPYLERFMRRGVGERIGQMRATPDLRAAVRFQRVNLNDDRYPVAGPFDLIFCRNVLIYFSQERRAAVIERLTDLLAPGGLLFVGHAESLHQHRARLAPVQPTVYTRITG